MAQNIPPGRPELPAIALEKANRGEAAIAALAEHLPAVARHYGLDPAELAAKLRKDHDLWVDHKGQLFFAESHTPDSTLAPESLEAATAAEALVPLDQTFRLHSRAGTTRKIYLDFDGHTTSGTSWRDYRTGSSTVVTPPYDFDGNPGSFSAAELEWIQYIWQRVVEDYAMFEVDVTTEDPGVEGLRKTTTSDNAYGIRVCIGGSSTDWYSSGGYGGVAYVGSFDYNSDTPCFVFENNLGDGAEKYTAEAVSHEVGHTLDLYHDGTSTQGYYTGHGSGADSWAPIMGVGYYSSVVQWSRGEYSGANNTEDDLAKISASQNIPYLADDYGNDFGNAATLTAGSFQVSGVIGRSTDVDFFRFDAAAGTFNINVAVDSRSPNLNVELTLFNSSGAAVAISNPADGLGAGMALSGMPAGTYFLRVDGVGAANPLNTGYSDYGSLGAYTLSGTTPSAAGPVAVALASTQSGPAPLTVSFSSSACNDPDGAITQWLWTFGDGNSSAQAEAAHTYAAPGVYTATLQVMDNTGLTDSDSVTITVQGPPTAPSGLTVSATCNNGDANYAALSVAWQDNSNNETLFRIQWSTDGYSWSEGVTTTGNSYTHGWLSFGATMFYRVRAENQSGYSAWTGPSGGTTHLVPTGAPGLSASAVPASQISLNWTAVANATGYRIERSTDQNSWVIVANTASTSSSYSDTSVSGSTTYHYRVSAVGYCGYSSAPSAVASATTPVGALTAPTRLSARAVSNSEIQLTWRDNAPNESDYQVERSSGSGAWAVIANLPANTTKFVDAGLARVTTYHYRVRAFNGASTSAYSAVVNATTRK